MHGVTTYTLNVISLSLSLSLSLLNGKWLAHLEFELGTLVRVPGRATIPLSSNLGQVVYSHCLRSFSAPRNWGTKGSFRRLSGYGDYVD